MLKLNERRDMDTKREVADLIAEFGAKRVEALLNVHRVTVDRWERGSMVPSQAVLFALRAAVRGQLPGMESRVWEGWRFDARGTLHSPSGYPYRPGDLEAQQFERALIRSQKARIRELETKLALATRGGVSAANDGELSVRLDLPPDPHLKRV